MTKRNEWKRERNDDICRRYAAGERLVDIAKFYGISSTAVRQQVIFHPRRLRRRERQAIDCLLGPDSATFLGSEEFRAIQTLLGPDPFSAYNHVGEE